MYIPKQFDEPRTEVLHALMRTRPLATLVTHGPDGLEANHIPLHLAPEPAPLGALRGHIARANPLHAQCDDGHQALAIFHGPQAYITPTWYPTKAETGKVVPTWNYVVVQVYGTLRVIDDSAWLRAHLETLTDEHEAALPDPWHVADAPSEYTDRLIEAIVGIELTITRLVGKWKTSQNQPAQNRAGVAQGLRACGEPDAVAMAALVENAANPRRP